MSVSDYQAIIDQEAKANGIEPSILTALIQVESSGNPYAVSEKGAVGLGQLMPATAAELGVNPWIPAENIKGAAKYLAQMIKGSGNIFDGLRSYNAGLTGAKNNQALGVDYATKILDIAKQDGPIQTGNVDASGITDWTSNFFKGLTDFVDSKTSAGLEWAKSSAINVFLIIAAMLAIIFAAKKLMDLKK